MIREIDCEKITQTVARLCIDANKILPPDIVCAVDCACGAEAGALPIAIMQDIRDNIDCAKSLDIPVCQDTGMAVVFAEIGQDTHIVGGDFEDAVNRGVALGYTNGLLRKSVVADPLNRVNTNDNTPAVIHTKIVKGDKITLTVAPKGFGSENMSGIKMLTPSATYEDVVGAVVDIVKRAGANPCPPMVIGVGIGGDFEKCAYLAKVALCRSADSYNQNEFYKNMEIDLLNRVNALGIGPQGFGGLTTALKVNVEYFPTHIAGLPVAVNIGCHVTRHKTAVVE